MIPQPQDEYESNLLIDKNTNSIKNKLRLTVNIVKNFRQNKRAINSILK